MWDEYCGIEWGVLGKRGQRKGFRIQDGVPGLRIEITLLIWGAGEGCRYKKPPPGRRRRSRMSYGFAAASRRRVSRCGDADMQIHWDENENENEDEDQNQGEDGQ